LAKRAMGLLVIDEPTIQLDWVTMKMLLSNPADL